MADFTVRSDAVNVEQIMDQIRARIREKRGVDYTEDQIRELATVKLQKFLDPRGVRSDLLEQFRHAHPPLGPEDFPNYAFEDHTLFGTHRKTLRFIRRLLNPILKLFFNPNRIIQALNIQSRLNTSNAERETRRRALESLYYELIHNLVVETTRHGIEVKNLTMRVESLASRLEFSERRARALESAVVFKPAPTDIVVTATPADSRQPAQGGGTPGPPQGTAVPEGPGQRSRRRRRRRGRRSGPPAATMMGGGAAAAAPNDQEVSVHSPSAEAFEQAMGSEAHGGESAPEPSEPPPATPSGSDPDSQ
jgi:hypothetical protein